MAQYSTQKSFNATRIGGDSALLVVKANGGSVALEYEIDNGYVQAEVFTSDTVVEFNTGSDFRLTPSGGAVYVVA